MDEMSYNKLSTEEERVIVHKGTEAPFSGKYNDFFEKGSYHCKRCNARLYSADNKFASTMPIRLAQVGALGYDPAPAI